MKQDVMIVANIIGNFTEIYKALYRNKMNVILFDNIEDAQVGLTKHSPAFILLDYDIKGMNSLLNKIVTGCYKPYPYIIAAAFFSDGAARASMLRNGIDACIDKPIHTDEVLAVIEAVLRREQRNAEYRQGSLRRCIEHRELTIDPLRRRVTMRGEEIALTVKEFDVLCTLASHAGAVLTKEEIYKRVWNVELNLNAPIVADHISSIRRKLGLSRKSNDYIQTVFGVGYRFEK